jgi:hypothetical protein
VTFKELAGAVGKIFFFDKLDPNVAEVIEKGNCE